MIFKNQIDKFLDDRKARSILQKVIKEFEDQAQNPPGKDPVIAACYLATLNLIKKDLNFKNFLLQIIKKRSDLTSAHFVNLFFRTIQYMKLFRENNTSSYLDEKYYVKSDWTRDLKNLLSNQKLKNEFTNLLLTKDTSATKYQRYISLQAITNWFFPKKDVAVADLGCGGNYGLKGLELGEKFENIIDQTPNHFFSRLLTKQINLSLGLGVDKEDPEEKQAHNWRIACSFYPKELNEISSVLEFEKRLQKSKKVTFLKTNLLTEKINSHSKFDIVIISTLLYQISSNKNRNLIINKAKKLLTKEGILVIQDFARFNDLDEFDFSQSWFNKPFTYNTFIASPLTNWRFLWIFSWENGRCLKVKGGRDLKLLLDGQLPSASSAAFAHSTS